MDDLYLQAMGWRHELQTMGIAFHLSKLPSSARRTAGDHGCEVLHLRPTKVHRLSRTSFQEPVRQRHQLCGWEEKLTDNELVKIRSYTTNQGCEWVFKPPHASHFGGVWEQQIRSILDSMLTQIGSSQLTHKLLTTLMEEVTSVVNSRPLMAVPSNMDDPRPLTTATLMSMKERPLTSRLGKFTPEELYARRW